MRFPEALPRDPFLRSKVRETLNGRDGSEDIPDFLGAVWARCSDGEVSCGMCGFRARLVLLCPPSIVSLSVS